MDIGAAFSFLTFSTDWLIIIGFGLFAAFAAYTAGTSRAVAFALALPIMLYALPLIEDTALVGSLTSQKSTPILAALLAAAVLVMFFLLISRMLNSYGERSGRITQALIAGAASAAICTVSWIQLPASAALWEFGPSVTAVFGTSYALLWVIAAFLTLAFARN